MRLNLYELKNLLRNGNKRGQIYLIQNKSFNVRLEPI